MISTNNIQELEKLKSIKLTKLTDAMAVEEEYEKNVKTKLQALGFTGDKAQLFLDEAIKVLEGQGFRLPELS